MSKKRVHEIAKEQGISSKELLEKLHAAGVEAKTASSRSRRPPCWRRWATAARR